MIQVATISPDPPSLFSAILSRWSHSIILIHHILKPIMNIVTYQTLFVKTSTSTDAGRRVIPGALGDSDFYVDLSVTHSFRNFH